MAARHPLLAGDARADILSPDQNEAAVTDRTTLYVEMFVGFGLFDDLPFEATGDHQALA